MPHRTQATLDALDDLVEVFVGLSSELEWSTSEDISRKELLPIFMMCASHTLSPEQALDVVISNILVKRDETFAVLLKMVQRLNKELAQYNLISKNAVSETEGGDGTDIEGDEPV